MSAREYEDQGSAPPVESQSPSWAANFAGGILAGIILSLAIWTVGTHLKAGALPHGKAYKAAGAIIMCQPFDQHVVSSLDESAYRVIVRTTDNFFFEVAFRGSSQPPPFGNMVGELGYHECGVAGGRVVHCFDSFKLTKQHVVPLDSNGKEINDRP
jgi:hypothetical protein